MALIKYTIEIPEDQAGDLQAFMQERQIPFDPRGKITATREIFLSETTAMGDDVKELTQKINERLDEAGIADRVRKDHENWTLPQLQEFLEFAINDFNWEDGQIVHAWFEDVDEEQEEKWADARGPIPWLFEKHVEAEKDAAR